MRLTHDGRYFSFSTTFEERHIPKNAGFGWDPAGKVWVTHHPDRAQKLRKYADPAALKALELAGFGRERELTADEVHELARSSAVRPGPDDAKLIYPPPEGLSLMPFQEVGVSWALEKKRVLLAESPGTGKTIMFAHLLNQVGTSPVLVLCPTSVTLNWKRELLKWVTWAHEGDVEVATSSSELPESLVVIVPYSRIAALAPLVKERDWNVLGLDESHYLKDPRSQRTKAVYGHGKKNPPIRANRVVAMTGTPVLNRPIELWSTLHFLDPGRWPSEMSYALMYCAAHKTNFGWDLGGASNLEDLSVKLRTTVMIRRKKADVLPQLPPKTRQIIELPVSKTEKFHVAAESDALSGLPDELRTALLALDLPEDRGGGGFGLLEIAAARKRTALLKVTHVISHVSELLDSDEAGASKVIVFAHHHDVLDQLTAGLIGKKHGVVQVDGRMSATERDRAIQRFWNDPECRVFVGGIDAAGTGINLQCASTVVFAEMSWVPGTMIQAEDRAWRHGQESRVLIQHLVLDGSIDAQIARRLVEKQSVIEATLEMT